MVAFKSRLSTDGRTAILPINFSHPILGPAADFEFCGLGSGL